MKTPGKFGEEKVLTSEERLIEIERKYSIMIGRIQAYDKILHEFNSLKSALNIQSELQKNTASQVDKLLTVMNDYNSRCEKMSQESKSDILSLVSKINSIPSSIEEVKTNLLNNISSIRDFVSSIDVKHTCAQAKFLLPNELQELNESLLKLISNNTNAINQFNQKVKSLESFQKNLEEKYSVFRGDHDYLISLTGHLKKTTDEKFRDSEAKMESLRSFVEDSTAKIKDQVINYMKDMKLEMIGSPSSIEFVRKEILNNLNIATIDSSNAYLKSSNNEQQIKILEKRLENLSMLMKKNDLNKMQ